MNIDFHYFATYLAARVAGMGHKDAKVVAHASQYVDDSVSARIDQRYLPGLSRITPTTETNQEIFGKNIVCTQSNIQESEQIWESFHFLPGNIHPKDHKENYAGTKEWRIGWMKYTYGTNEEKKFSMMCLPNSVLSESMIKDILNYEGQPCFLEMVGIRMHVLADTWAHCYFAGTPSWWINEISKEVYYTDNFIDENRRNQKVPFIQAKSIKELKLELPFVTTPSAIAFDSYVYLGHGRMGHIPDEPYMCYRYVPKWSNKEIVKDNVNDYMKAFRQMVKAMSCILKKEEYHRDTYADIDEVLEAELKKIFQNTKYSVSKSADIWMPLIEKCYPEAKNDLEYNPDEWMNEAKSSVNNINSHYYNFNYAAVMHLEFVEHYLMNIVRLQYEQSDQSVDNTDEKTTWFALTKTDRDSCYRCSRGLKYLSHDRSKWLAHVQDGKFNLHPDGNLKKMHTGNYIDYLSETGQKWRAELKDGILVHMPLETNVEILVSKSIKYLDWDEKVQESCFVKQDALIPSADMKEILDNQIRFFGIGTETDGWVKSISSQIQFVNMSGEELKNYLFEFKKMSDGLWKFCVNVRDEKTTNLLVDQIIYVDEKDKPHTLRIEDDLFVVDDSIKGTSITLKGWGGNAMKISMVCWEKTELSE